MQSLKIEKLKLLLFLTISTFIAFYAYDTTKNADTIRIHIDKELDLMYIILKDPPISERGRINWWTKNRQKIINTYDLNKNKKTNIIVVLYFGNGYKELEKYDRFCFNDMPEPVNCIDKNYVMRIENPQSKKDEEIYFDYNTYKRKTPSEQFSKIDNQIQFRTI